MGHGEIGRLALHLRETALCPRQSTTDACVGVVDVCVKPVALFSSKREASWHSTYNLMGK